MMSAYGGKKCKSCARGGSAATVVANLAVPAVLTAATFAAPTVGRTAKSGTAKVSGMVAKALGKSKAKSAEKTSSKEPAAKKTSSKKPAAKKTSSNKPAAKKSSSKK